MSLHLKTLKSLRQNIYAEDNEDNPLSFDIETNGGFITCIGFAPSDSVAIVVPFKDTRKRKQNYWENSEARTTDCMGLGSKDFRERKDY